MAQVVPIQKFNDPETVDPKVAHARMMERIKEIKSDPAKYHELRERLKGKSTDEERAEVLVEFITDNQSLVAALPEGEDRIVGALTITVTTVFIFSSPAY